MDWKTCFSGKKILIAEDDEMNRELMQDIFAAMNCTPVFAFDGNQVVEKYKSEIFDIIFMDIRMPNKDGIQATKEIREIENKNKKMRIPILALTASIIDQDKRKCLEAGVNDFVAKPIHLAELREKMAKYLLNI